MLLHSKRKSIYTSSFFLDTDSLFTHSFYYIPCNSHTTYLLTYSYICTFSTSISHCSSDLKLHRLTIYSIDLRYDIYCPIVRHENSFLILLILNHYFDTFESSNYCPSFGPRSQVHHLLSLVSPYLFTTKYNTKTMIPTFLHPLYIRFSFGRVQNQLKLDPRICRTSGDIKLWS